MLQIDSPVNLLETINTVYAVIKLCYDGFTVSK